MRFPTLISSAPLASAFALAAFGAAHAQALDADFRNLCVAHKGEMTAVLAGADAAGWTALPAGATPPELPGGAKLKTFALRLHSVGAATRLLVVGEGAPDADPARGGEAPPAMRICFMASPQPDPASLASEKALLKGAPVFQDGQASMYLVDKATGDVSPLQGDAAMAKMKAGVLATLMLVDTPQATAFAYQAPITKP